MSEFNQDYHIDITGVDVIKLIKKAYDMSQAQGMGFLHFKEGGMTDAEAKAQIREGRYMASMDYVQGRAVKFAIYREGEQLFINNNWFDHSLYQLQTLLAEVGVKTTISHEGVIRKVV